MFKLLHNPKVGICVLLTLLPAFSQAREKSVKLQSTKGSIKVRIDAMTKVKKEGSSFLIHGDVTLPVDDSDWLISPDSAANLSHLDMSECQFKKRWIKFAAVGYTAVLEDLDGSGCIAIIEEFGDDPPEVIPVKRGIKVINCKTVRVVPFEKGGYREVASIFRAWMKMKGHYRHILEKPLGKEIAGAAAMRPVQHGAISEEVWDKVQPIVPSAVLVWRQFGGPGEGLENFSIDLQKKLNTSGRYFFLPWGSLLTPVAEEAPDGRTSSLGFSSMPESMIRKWSWVDDEGELRHPMVGHGGGKQATKSSKGLLCAHGQVERIEHWISKVATHPYCYRMDGVNLDSMAYYLKASHYPGNCDSKTHPATFKGWTEGLEAMFKAAYDKGLMISHEGCVFFLDKYALHTYGKSMVSLGIYTGWYLLPDGADKEPEKIIKTITHHVPVNEMIYHDQLALRIHDAEALNIRYITPEQYQKNRQIKHVFNALYGLTPNLQLGGPEADRLILEDLEWMEKEMPRALETYRLLYGLELTNHEFLSKDRLVQQTTFEGGIKIIANFSDSTTTVDRIKIPAIGYVVVNGNER
jgi:hypothetical protein